MLNFCSHAAYSHESFMEALPDLIVFIPHFKLLTHYLFIFLPVGYHEN